MPGFYCVLWNRWNVNANRRWLELKFKLLTGGTMIYFQWYCDLETTWESRGQRSPRFLENRIPGIFVVVPPWSIWQPAKAYFYIGISFNRFLQRVPFFEAYPRDRIYDQLMVPLLADEVSTSFSLLIQEIRNNLNLPCVGILWSVPPCLFVLPRSRMMFLSVLGEVWPVWILPLEKSSKEVHVFWNSESDVNPVLSFLWKTRS